MLVLSRKVGEKIVIGDNITIVVNRVSGNRISLGIDAPGDVRIVRGELVEAADAFEDETPASRQTSPIMALSGLDLPSDSVGHRAR